MRFLPFLAIFACASDVDDKLDAIQDQLDALQDEVDALGDEGPSTDGTTTDDSDDGSDDSDSDSDNMRDGTYVFVTSQRYEGNLTGLTGITNPLAAADSLCAAAAASGGLDGTFVAWISTSNTDAIDRIQDVGPWTVVGRSEAVFRNKAAIVAGPNVEIEYDANGREISSSTRVWTGTGTGGLATVHTCNNWSALTDTYQGTFGRAYTDWTDEGSIGCESEAGLICFQQ